MMARWLCLRLRLVLILLVVIPNVLSLPDSYVDQQNAVGQNVLEALGLDPVNLNPVEQGSQDTQTDQTNGSSPEKMLSPSLSTSAGPAPINKELQTSNTTSKPINITSQTANPSLNQNVLERLNNQYDFGDAVADKVSSEKDLVNPVIDSDKLIVDTDNHGDPGGLIDLSAKTDKKGEDDQVADNSLMTAEGKDVPGQRQGTGEDVQLQDGDKPQRESVPQPSNGEPTDTVGDTDEQSLSNNKPSDEGVQQLDNSLSTDKGFHHLGIDEHMSEGIKPGGNDEPTDEGEPDDVELRLSDFDSTQKEDLTVDNPGDQKDEPVIGNPPTISESDLQDLTERIPDDLTSEERDVLRQNISDALGLSAFDPGVAMLPQGDNKPVQSGDKLTTAISSSTTSQSSLPSTKDGEGGRDRELVKGIRTITNVNAQPTPEPGDSSIGNLNGKKDDYSNTYSKKGTEEREDDNGDYTSYVDDAAGTDNNEENQKHQNTASININKEPNADEEGVYTNTRDNENGVSQHGESYGRKVLNEEDNDQVNDDSQEDPYYDYEDEDSDDYVGGEVHIPALALSSSTTTPEWIYNSIKDDGAAVKDQPSEGLAQGELTGNKDEPYNTESETREYDDYDDSWYYHHPDDRAKSTQSTVTPLSGSTPVPRPVDPLEGADSHVDGGDTHKSHTQIAAPEFKENVISSEDVQVKKALQAPKRTIILYTAAIVIFIAGIVLFTLWKNPFKEDQRRLAEEKRSLPVSVPGKHLL